MRILSGDRDLFQLVDDGRDIAVLYMGGGPYAKNSGPEEIRRDGVIARLGVTPEEVVDLKALTGDSSDNIPGVKGVGPKTAINLLKAYEHLDGIYAALEALEQAGAKAKDPAGVLKGALLQKLRDDKASAYRSRMLAEILVDIPLPREPRLSLGSVNGVPSVGNMALPLSNRPHLDDTRFSDFAARIAARMQEMGYCKSQRAGVEYLYRRIIFT